MYAKIKLILVPLNCRQKVLFGCRAGAVAHQTHRVTPKTLASPRKWHLRDKHLKIRFDNFWVGQFIKGFLYGWGSPDRVPNPVRAQSIENKVC